MFLVDSQSFPGGANQISFVDIDSVYFFYRNPSYSSLMDSVPYVDDTITFCDNKCIMVRCQEFTWRQFGTQYPEVICVFSYSIVSNYVHCTFEIAHSNSVILQRYD